MKKLLYTLLAAAAAAAGCQEAELDNKDIVSAGGPFMIEASISGTKTIFTPPNKVAWSSDDRLSVLVGGGAYMFKKSGEGDSFTGNGFAPEEGAEYVYHVIYPYDDGIKTMGADGFTEQCVTVPAEQTQSAPGDAGHIDSPLYGMAVAEGTAVPGVAMKHAATLFRVTVKNLSSAPLSVNSVSLSTDAAGGYIGGDFYVNTQTGALRPAEGLAESSVVLTVNGGEIAAAAGDVAGTGEFWIAAAPFSVPSGSHLTVSVVTSGGEIEIVKDAPESGWNFEAGKINYTEVKCTGEAPVVEDPKVGDYFFRDGTWSSSLTDANKGDCVGIIFETGQQPGDDISAYGEAGAGKEILGYVMALNNIGKVRLDFYGEGSTKFTLTEQMCDKELFNGYTNTKTYLSSDLYKANTSVYEALEKFDTWLDTAPVPQANASEWYIPSFQQLIRMVGYCHGYSNFDGRVVYETPVEKIPALEASLDNAVAMGIATDFVTDQQERPIMCSTVNTNTEDVLIVRYDPAKMTVSVRTTSGNGYIRPVFTILQ